MRDFFAGQVSLDMVCDLVERLLHEPASEFRAAVLEDPRFLGWGPTEGVIADVYDAVITLAKITAQVHNGKMRASMHERPRQGARSTSRSIADFPIHRYAEG